MCPSFSQRLSKFCISVNVSYKRKLRQMQQNPSIVQNETLQKQESVQHESVAENETQNKSDSVQRKPDNLSVQNNIKQTDLGCIIDTKLDAVHYMNNTTIYNDPTIIDYKRNTIIDKSSIQKVSNDNIIDYKQVKNDQEKSNDLIVKIKTQNEEWVLFNNDSFQ
jgi:hypothetical protein